VKVDKSFVAALNERTDTSRLAQAILELGRTLRLQTVAEGVEQEGQFAQLRDLRCDFGQGYYFARPLEEEQVQGFLRETCAGGLARPGRYGTEEPAA
jgi:EAL domain-containing protein (putative c-di-GMP-specific phosphodiesterase class I)